VIYVAITLGFCACDNVTADLGLCTNSTCHGKTVVGFFVTIVLHHFVTMTDRLTQSNDNNSHGPSVRADNSTYDWDNKNMDLQNKTSMR